MSSSESEQDFEEESNASSEQLYCSSSSFNEDDSDVEDREILGIEPYQFEPEVADDDEPAGKMLITPILKTGETTQNGR